MREGLRGMSIEGRVKDLGLMTLGMKRKGTDLKEFYTILC